MKKNNNFRKVLVVNGEYLSTENIKLKANCNKALDCKRLFQLGSLMFDNRLVKSDYLLYTNKFFKEEALNFFKENPLYIKESNLKLSLSYVTGTKVYDITDTGKYIRWLRYYGFIVPIINNDENGISSINHYVISKQFRDCYIQLLEIAKECNWSSLLLTNNKWSPVVDYYWWQ